MKKHLNTLYVTSPEAYVRKEGMTFVVELDGKKAMQAPLHTIENIVCFGFKPLTPALMEYCALNNITISYLSQFGKFLASVNGAQKGNVLLRKAQYAMHDTEEGSLAVARHIVAAKITNSRNILLRHLRNHDAGEDEHKIRLAINELARNLKAVEKTDSLDSLRGHEGESASIYFGCFDQLITSQKDTICFNGRNKRPPLDPVNALLSFVYMLMVNDVKSALETTGLDVQVGFLHRLRPGRPSLALDLMEEVRAYIADRVVLNLINLKQINYNDFEFIETGEIRIKDKARKDVLIAYQKKKDEEIEHPFLGEKITLGLLFHVQAMLLARYIRGDIEAYPPFYMK
ncbi:MAG: type I-C CRISPR-associated endonuclease Cas1 [Spirochaetes bacterium]|nr:type I-C CRISPR-associated endonuclease Cas1 [Spirochaetota bacterium]